MRDYYNPFDNTEGMGAKADRLHDARKDRLMEQDLLPVRAYGQTYPTIEELEQKTHFESINDQDLYFARLSGRLSAYYFDMREVIRRQQKRIAELEHQVEHFSSTF